MSRPKFQPSIYIREAPSSNFGRDNDYSEFLRDPPSTQKLPAECLRVYEHFILNPSPNSSVNLPFDSTLPELLNALLNKS
jgi:hypothetical protein